MKFSGLAWPAYEHVLELSPGDVVAFDGKAAYHANVVYPADEACLETLGALGRRLGGSAPLTLCVRRKSK